MTLLVVYLGIALAVALTGLAVRSSSSRSEDARCVGSWCVLTCLAWPLTVFTATAMLLRDDTRREDDAAEDPFLGAHGLVQPGTGVR